MHWQFWHRPMSEGTSAPRTRSKLPRPKELPSQIGHYLVVRRKMDPDYVWSLRCVVRPYPDDKRKFDFRLYDPVEAQAQRVPVADYHSLDASPSLIRFSGSYHKDHLLPEWAPDRTAAPAEPVLPGTADAAAMSVN